MRFAESYSVIVIPKDRSRIRRWILSRERILGTLGLAAGLTLFTTVVCVGLSHYHREYLATEDLRERGKQYEVEREHLLGRMENLEQVVRQNEQLAFRLESIVGINGDKGVQVGVGGESMEGEAPLYTLAALEPSSLQNAKSRLFDEGSLKYFNLKTIDLTLEAGDVGDRLKDVYHFKPDATYFWSAMPTIAPVKGWVTSDFGFRRSPMSGHRQFHQGLDIASPYGSPVISAGDGVVLFAGRYGGLGNKVVVDHGYGIVSVYGHNSSILVRVGDRVSRGQLLAKVGSTGRSTGPHLHYEVMVDGVPVDPTRFILDEAL